MNISAIYVQKKRSVPQLCVGFPWLSTKTICHQDVVRDEEMAIEISLRLKPIFTDGLSDNHQIFTHEH